MLTPRQVSLKVNSDAARGRLAWVSVSVSRLYIWNLGGRSPSLNGGHSEDRECLVLTPLTEILIIVLDKTGNGLGIPNSMESYNIC